MSWPQTNEAKRQDLTKKKAIDFGLTALQRQELWTLFGILLTTSLGIWWNGREAQHEAAFSSSGFCQTEILVKTWLKHFSCFSGGLKILLCDWVGPSLDPTFLDFLEVFSGFGLWIVLTFGANDPGGTVICLYNRPRGLVLSIRSARPYYRREVSGPAVFVWVSLFEEFLFFEKLDVAMSSFIQPKHLFVHLRGSFLLQVVCLEDPTKCARGRNPESTGVDGFVFGWESSPEWRQGDWDCRRIGLWKSKIVSCWSHFVELSSINV